MTRPVDAGPPRARDPYGLGPVGSVIAPALSIVGLVLVAIVTLDLLQGDVPFGIGSGNGNGGAVDPGRTAAPSGVVVVPDEAAFDGAIVYAKAGNIWIQIDDEATQLTETGGDTMPSWSGDGTWIYYVHTDAEEGRWPVNGVVESYALDVPKLMRIRADGTGAPEELATSRITKGEDIYAFWIRQPALSPDGTTVALVSDAPDPDESTVVLQLFDPASGEFTKLDVGVKGVLGHQDPEWRPDGRFLLYVRNGRDGSRGAPVIMRYNMDNGNIKEMTGPGYLQPAYSPDGKYIAATRTSSLGSNVVILDGATGRELLRLTDDDRSWSPTWSPAGNGIAYLHIEGQTVDLRLARLGGTWGAWTLDDTVPLTEVSGLDADSGPDWFIPAADLPVTPPPATPAPSSAAPVAPSSSPSAAP